MIKVAINETSESTRVMTIEVPQDQVTSTYQAITSKIRDKANLPGFRKGKVPLDLVEKNYAQKIHEEVLDRLFSLSYPHALEEHKIVPIERPRVDKVELDKNKPLIYQVTVDVLPKVKLGTYKGMKLKAAKVKVAAKDINEVLENLRNHHAELISITDRPAQSGDVVTIDFKGEKDGEVLPGTAANDYRIELGSGQTIPDFENNIIGMKNEETKSFEATFPKDYHAQEMAGQKIVFTVTMKSMQEKKLADLNDEFAKDMGKFDSLDGLKKQIEEDLTKEKERQNKIVLTDQINKELAQGSKVTVPEVLINRSLDRLLFDYEMRLQRQQKTLADAGVTAEEFKNKNRDQVEMELKAQLALREIGLVESLEVSDEEVNQEADRAALAARQSPEAYKAYLTKNNGWEDLREKCRDTKAIDLIIENAKIAYN